MNNEKRNGRWLLLIIVILEWLALSSQYFLIVTTSDLTFAEATIRFLSFFTILTNSIVAVCATVIVVDKRGRIFDIFSRHTTLTAITVYILIVGAVYNVALRQIQHLGGIHRINAEIFHTVVPLLFLWYWASFTNKQRISWSRLLTWQVYPLLYVIYTLIHGRNTSFYPYPFVDVTKIGFIHAMRNGAIILVAFMVLSAVFIGLSNRQSVSRHT